MASFLRRIFGTESIGDIPTRHIAVLLYLATIKREQRLGSPQKIADFLGLGSENTVVRAYQFLWEKGYIAMAEDLPKGEIPRDARLLEVTRLGKKALRPLFNVVGIAGLLGFICLSLVIGGLFGYLYAGALPYFDQYPVATIGVSLFIVVTYVLLISWFWRTARKFRTEQLFKMFRAEAKAN
jgi:hypothetical protein